MYSFWYNSCDLSIISKLKLPAVDGSDIENEFDGPTRASTSVSRMTVRLPQTSMAGVHGEEADRFMEYQDPTERVVPTEHVWTPSSDIIMGCVGGQLIKVTSAVFQSVFERIYYWKKHSW